MTSTAPSNFTDAPQMPYGMPNGPPNDMQRPQPGQGAPHNGDAGSNQAWAMQNPRTNQMMYHHSTPASPNQFAMPQGNVDDKRHVMPGAPQHMGGEDWNHMFHAGGQENYLNPIFSGYDQGHHDVKNEHPEGAPNGSYYISSTSLGADGMLRPPPWHLDESVKDPLQLKADQLVDFLFPGGLQESLEQQQNNLHIRACLTPESIKRCLEAFSNFQGHWPFLHMPTFSINSIAYDGFWLVLISLGGIYSDHVTKTQVKDLMQCTKQGIERSASILKNIGSGQKKSASGVEFAELQALLLLQTLSIWNGGPLDRAPAREESRRVFHLARKLGLLELAGPDDTMNYSYLHNLAPGQAFDASNFKWQAWVEQEKRVRTMTMIYLLDCALNIVSLC
jgi:Fungal specific transcription factor domain